MFNIEAAKGLAPMWRRGLAKHAGSRGFGQGQDGLGGRALKQVVLALAALLVFATGAFAPGDAAQAQDGFKSRDNRIWDNKPSRLVYGNYCGFGTRYGTLAAEPVNRLDRACQAHDACYIAGYHHCECDERLASAARLIVQDRTIPRKERIAARAIIDVFTARICKLFPRGVFPPRNPDILKGWFPPAPPQVPDTPGLSP